VLQLHGNAENISTHFTSVAWMPAQGFNVFAMDYRGYGASEGVATLEGVQLDIDAAMRTLLARGDVDKDRIVIYGQSLGGALAAYNVPHSPYRDRIRALILESSFSDYIEIARESSPTIGSPGRFNGSRNSRWDDRFSPLPAMPKISPIPVLISTETRTRWCRCAMRRFFTRPRSSPSSCGSFPARAHPDDARSVQRDRLVAYLRAALAAAPGSE